MCWHFNHQNIIEMAQRHISLSNSYQASLKMTPFEALYVRKCRTLLYWNQMGESQVFGPEILQEAEKHNLKKIEAHLTEAVRLAAPCGLTKQELTEMLELLWEE